MYITHNTYAYNYLYTSLCIICTQVYNIFKKRLTGNHMISMVLLKNDSEFTHQTNDNNIVVLV